MKTKLKKMKIGKMIISISILLFTSCAVTDYYQVYKTTNINGAKVADKIIFEDENCKVYYNLWTEGGDVGFGIYNKTENNLIIDLTNTFFVLNGIAYDYYQNRIFSHSSGSEVAVTFYNNSSNTLGTRSKDFSTSFTEKPQLVIPPKTMRFISEYKITYSQYRDCNLSVYPSRKNIKTLSFDTISSPFVFYNLISYTTDKDTISIKNRFYVSEITNYPSTEMFVSIDTNACGKDYDFPIQVYKDVTPDAFYIKYKAR